MNTNRSTTNTTANACDSPGWLLFMVFAGVGFVSLPMDLIRAFVGRPRSTIPRSEYVTRAMALQARAVTIKVR